MKNAEEAAKAYWDLLGRESNDVYTTSHHFLRMIEEKFGAAAIDAALVPLIEAERQQILARQRAFVEQERAKWLN